MRKLLLLLLLFPLISFAKFYEGTITLKDGTVKSGLVEVPRHSKADEIKFKVGVKGKEEILEIKNVSAFTIINDGQTLEYITLKLSSPKLLSRKYKVDEEISWVRVDYEGDISLVIAFLTDPLSSRSGEPVYYIHKKGEDYCSYVAIFYSNLIQIAHFSEIKSACEVIFKDDCPQLPEKLTKEAFKERNLMAIIDLYRELCGK